MQRKTPSFYRLIQVDYPSVITISLPVMVWISFIIFFVLGLLIGSSPLVMFTHTSLVSWLFYGGLILSVLSTPVLIWRYRLFNRVFSEGIDVQGVIRGVGFFRDRGSVEITYTYDGIKHVSRIAVQKDKRTTSLKSGTPVELVVDPTNPERAFIKDLFL